MSWTSERNPHIYEQMIFFNIGVKQSRKNSLLKNGARKLCNLPPCMHVCVRVCVHIHAHQ